MPKQLHKKRLKQIARVHAFFLAGLFLLYIGLSSIYSPEFLLADIRNKYSAIADGVIAVTAKVLAPPITPVLSGLTKCTNGNLFNTISWPIDEGTETFSIFKNDLPLATNITNTSFIDNTINVNTSYKYQVVASGQMGPGFASSDPIIITTPLECKAQLPKPTVSALLSMNNISFLRPTFIGTSNIPVAIINIEVHSAQTIFAQTIANANGYWTWTSPTDITIGQHTLLVSAIDPNDQTRFANASLIFDIKDDSSDNQESNTNKNNNNDHGNSIKKSLSTNKNTNLKDTLEQNNPPNQSPATLQQESSRENPIDFSLTIAKNSIYQNSNLDATIEINSISQNSNFNNSSITFGILDFNSKQVLEITEEKNISQGNIINKNIQLPKSLIPGEYKLRIEIANNKFNISKEANFKILPMPLLDLGAGIIITYPEILSKLGSITIATFLLFLIWILLFSREYWLYLHAFNNITERHLAKIGSFGARKRKGVSR